MELDFRREYLIRLPLPLAQLYARARNAKDGRGRHDNCFYLFESLIKIAGLPLVAAYVEELRKTGEHVDALDNIIVQLALPSLGQFVGILRETSRYFGERDDADEHPMGHCWKQLNEKRKDLDGMLGLFRRIKNGPEGKPAGDKTCTILQLIDALVTYRNAVIGHGAGRASSFYEEEMGPLMFPAVNDIFADGVWQFLGPKDSRLVLLESADVDGDKCNVEVRELQGMQSERSSPITLGAEFAEGFRPDSMAIIWPGRKEPLMLDPLLVYAESEISEDIEIINRDRNRKQAEYLSYATGETRRDKKLSPVFQEFLGVVAAKMIAAKKAVAEQEEAEKAEAEAAAQAAAEAEEEEEEGDYELLAELGRGGMGVVYLARQRSLGRLVAMKMLPTELQENEVALLRFRREMRALGHCEHPNIVKVIACGTMPTGELYYAMEYVPGADLEQLWYESAERHGDRSMADLTSASFSGALTVASTKMRAQTAERTRSGLASQAGLGPSLSNAGLGDVAPKSAPQEEFPKKDGEAKDARANGTDADASADSKSSDGETKERKKTIAGGTEETKVGGDTDSGKAGPDGTSPSVEGDRKQETHTASSSNAQSEEATGTENTEVAAADAESIQENVPTVDELDILPELPEFNAPDNDPGGYGKRIARLIRDAAHALQTVHGQGLIHRDIKPANLMLTPDGERVVLMDFGLAKEEGMTSEVSAGAGFLGTLRYAPPEQIESSSKNLGPQADIRALGVTMWELLTRKKLFGECEDEAQLTRAILEQDVPLLRTIDPTFDRDIEAIVARATERSVSDRIQTADDFVLYLDLYLDGQQLPIRTPGIVEMVWRWVKAHKALCSTVAGSVAAVTITFIVAFILITIAHQHEKEARIAENKARGEATEKFVDARNTIDVFLTGVSDGLKHYPGVQGTRSRLLELAADDLQRFAEEKSEYPELQAESGKAFVRLGNVRLDLLDYENAQAAYRSAEARLEELSKATPDDVNLKMELANSRVKLATLFTLTGRLDDATKMYGPAIETLESLAKNNADDTELQNVLAVALLSRAGLLQKLNQFKEAEAAATQSVSVFAALTKESDDRRFQFALGRAWQEVARVQSRAGRNQDSVETVRKAIDQFELLAVGDEENPDYLEALASTHISQANAMRTLGRTAEMLDAYEAAVQAYELLSFVVPDNPGYELSQAVARINLGQVQHRQGNNLEAYQHLSGALQILLPLVELSPLEEDSADEGLHEKHAACLTTYGRVLLELNGLLESDPPPIDLADSAFEQAYVKYDALIKRSPEVLRYLEGKAVCVSNWARLKHQLGDSDSAKQFFEVALGDFEFLLGESPDDPYYIDGTATTAFHAAFLFRDLSDDATTDALCRKSLDLRRKLTTEPEHLHRLAWLLANCPSDKVRDPKAAVESATQAVKLAPENPRFLNGLGVAQFRAGDLDTARETLIAAAQNRPAVPVEDDPDAEPAPEDNAFDLFFLAMLHGQRNDEGDADVALQLFRLALEAMNARRPGHIELSRIRDEAATKLGIELGAPEEPASPPGNDVDSDPTPESDAPASPDVDSANDSGATSPDPAPQD